LPGVSSWSLAFRSPNVVEYVDTNNLCNFADLTMHVEQACLI